MSFSLRQARYFVATAEHGRVSRAAVALAISQSAVTTAIRDLEAALGFVLFVRTRSGMELTHSGRRFLSVAYDLLSKVEEARSIGGEDTGCTGTITVAATYTVIGYFLPAHLRLIRRRFPGLDIRLVEQNRRNIEAGLLENRYDLAVMLTSNITSPGLETGILLRSPRRLWVADRHPLLSCERVGLSRVAGEPYIMLTIDEAARTAGRYWASTPWRPAVRLRTSSVEAVRSMVANDLGVTILSDMVWRPWSLEGKRLETIDLVDPVPSMDIGLAWKRGVRFTPVMEAFRAYFRQGSLTDPVS